MERNRQNAAAKVVSSALVGMDLRVVLVGGRSYFIQPPTIRRLAGAACHLADVGEGATVRDVLRTLTDAAPLAHALSWFIRGDDTLYEELSKGTFDEVLDALEAAFSLISIESFQRLSALTRNVASLTARPRR